VTKLQETTFGAKLDEPLFELLCTEHGRETLRHVLVESYFHPRLHQRLLHQGVVNVKAFQYGETLLQRAKSEIKEVAPTFAAVAEEETAVRDQGFRRAIVRAYEHRCALCGVRILTSDGHTAIDAAHIIPWSESKNDDPRNGLALCRLCHWTFDEGLATIRSNYRIRLSPQLTANDNIPGHLATMNDRDFIAPPDRDLWPFAESLKWHRRHRFRAR
jgi:putative restriction endonuclease